MHFTKLRLNGLTVVDLPILDAKPTDTIILKEVDGLGPPDVDVSIAKTLNAGGFYQGRRPQERYLIAKVGLNPNYKIGMSASDLRTTLYGLLTPGVNDNVVVELLDGATVIAKTTGYVEKMEINPFSKDPEVDISIPCLEKYFSAPALLFVAPASKSAPVIANTGSAPAGIHLEVVFTGALASWTLTNAGGKKMQVTYNFVTGDKLEIDTRPGFRGIWVTRGGVRTNIIYGLSTDSVWFMLYGGDNAFTTSSQAFNWGDVYYLPQYWGI